MRLLRTSVLGVMTIGILLLSRGGADADAGHFLRFPWTFGQASYITQGYNGPTHQNGDYYALDVDIQYAFVQGVIRAAVPGTVVGRVANQFCTGFMGGHGNYVDIRSVDPNGAVRYAKYAHMATVSVTPTQPGVYRGQKIGVEGDSGYSYVNANQPCGIHLHFRWTSTQNCTIEPPNPGYCALPPEPMSGYSGLGIGEKTSNNFPYKADFSGDGCPDMVARMAGSHTGRLYPGNCGYGWKNPSGSEIGTGWNALNWILGPGDWNNDGCGDMIGRVASNGEARLYTGNCQGGWFNSAGHVISGSNWNTDFNYLVAPGDLDNDGCVDLLGRITSNGEMRLYRGNCGLGFFNPGGTVIAYGWGSYTKFFGPGDFNNNGCADLVSVVSSGQGYLHSGACNGGIGGVGTQISGSNWNTDFNALLGASDFDTDGCADMIGRITSNGDGRLYTGNCAYWWKNDAGYDISGSNWNTAFTWLW